MLSDLSRAVTSARLIEPITASRSIGRTNLRSRLRTHATNRYTFVDKAPQTLTAVIDMVSLQSTGALRAADGSLRSVVSAEKRKYRMPATCQIESREQTDLLIVQRLFNSNIVQLTVGSLVASAEVTHIADSLLVLIEKYGEVRVLECVHDQHGDEVNRIWDRLAGNFDHSGQVSHVAVVATRSQIELLRQRCCPLPQAEVRYYEPADLEAAGTWLGVVE